MDIKDYKLLLGDSRELLKTIETNSIDAIVTDPPYRIIAGGVRILYENNEIGGVLNKRDWSKTDPKGVLNRGRRVVSDGTACSNKWLKKGESNIPSAVREGKMFEHNDITFSDWLPEAYRVLKEGTHCYVMVNGRNLNDLQNSAKKSGFVYQNLLVWHKPNTQTPNKYYMQNAEFILMLSKRPARNINKMGSKTVITIANIVGSKSHPTEKPTTLNEIFISNSTNEGEIVLDPFMGTGSCGVASKNLSRRFIGIEISEEYFNIAKRRIETA